MAAHSAKVLVMGELAMFFQISCGSFIQDEMDGRLSDKFLDQAPLTSITGLSNWLHGLPLGGCFEQFLLDRTCSSPRELFLLQT
jgi:hypothetical protein